MKLFHLSDLHLGKRLWEFSLLEDQKYILDEIISLAETERPDGVLIAGDIYDKSVPPAEAVELFDDFLYRLSGTGTKVFLISGNHDSAERVSFGGRMMEGSGIYVSRCYGGDIRPITLKDGDAFVDIWLLPFIKPGNVRRFSEEPVESYTDAVRIAVGRMPIDRTHRNVLVCHQFVTGANRCDSEEISVGGTDNVDATVFEPFDYVALGHIHGPQNVGENARYSGSPLKYSFSEISHEKSVTVVEFDGGMSYRTIPLKPLREVAEIKGKYDELVMRSHYEGKGDRECYVHAILTDEEDVPDAVMKLRTVYPFLAKLDYDNLRTRSNAELAVEEQALKQPFELFSDFYFQQNNQAMSEEQAALVQELLAEIGEEDE